MNPLVSIITASYNSENFIHECIESVLSQTYINWELLITDDCSTDNTLREAQRYADKDDRIKLFVLDKNSGTGAARNNSILNASGDFLAFLDSDDSWFPQKLSVQMEYYKEKPNVGLVYSDYYVNYPDSKYYLHFRPKKSLDLNSLLKTCDIGCLTVIINTKVTGKVIMSQIRKRQDYLLWLSIAKKGVSIRGINRPLAQYNVRHSSISSNKFKAANFQWKIYREELEIPLFRSFIFFSFYTIKGFFKYKFLQKVLKE